MARAKSTYGALLSGCCLAIWLLVVSPLSAFADAPCKSPEICHHTECELWVISSRCAPSCGDLAAGRERLRYYRIVDRRWEDATIEEFIASGDPSIPTYFMVHGNRMEPDSAMAFGQMARRGLCRYVPNQRLRAVIYLWPADQAALRPKKDVLIKEARSTGQAYYLSWIVCRMNPNVPVTLIGYSHGARTIAGALHMIAGGELSGRTAEAPPRPHESPLNAVLLASAIDSSALYPNRIFGRAVEAVDNMLITYNPRDRVLRFYEVLDPMRRMPALGHDGLSVRRLGENASKIYLLNVSRSVGPSHHWKAYLQSHLVLSHMAAHVALPEAMRALPPED